MRIWSAHSLHHPRVEAAKGGHELTFASAVAGVNFRSATSNVGVALSSRRLWHLVPAPLPAPTRKRVLLASDSSNLIKRRVPPEVGRGGHEMIRLIAVAFALALATSAQAMPFPQLDKQDGMVTQVRQNCGPGMRWNNALGRCATTSARRHVRRGVITGN